MVKIQFFCEHGHNAGNLFLRMKSRVVGERLELHGYLPVDPSKDVHELQLVRVLLEHGAERLDEPGPVLGVPPGIVARCCGVRIQEVCLHWNLLTGHVIINAAVGLNTAVQLCSSAGLNNEKFRFSS